MEQRGVGIQHQVVQKNKSKRDTQQIDMPPRLRWRVEIQVFQQQQIANGNAKPNASGRNNAGDDTDVIAPPKDGSCKIG